MSGRSGKRGAHESLYALGGRYFDLYTRQHGLQANLFLAPGEGDSVPEGRAGNGGANGGAEESDLARAARILRGRES